MPPKKKKGKKKKKKGGDGELTIDDKYKKTLDEIEALKDHLSIRKEFTRRSKAQQEEWREKMTEANHSLQEHEDTQRAVSADMTRQYKTMQTEMGFRVSMLEDELAKTRKQLELTDLKKSTEEKVRMERDDEIELTESNLKKTTEEKERMEREKDDEIELTECDLKKTTEEKDRMEREKDDEIVALRQKLKTMEGQFDRVFNDALDSLMDKITEAKPKWENKSTYIQSKNKQTLLEFGLNPLDI